MGRRKKEKQYRTKWLRDSPRQPSSSLLRWILPATVTGAVAVVVALGWIALSRESTDSLTNARPPDLANQDSGVVNPNARNLIRSGDSLPVTKLEMPDPSQDGWLSESLHQASNDQLKQLANWFATAAGDRLDSDKLQGIVDERFACTRLRPLALTEVFREPTLVVRRAANLSQIPTKEALKSESFSHVGPAGFADALTELGELLSGASDLHVKFKQYRIDLAHNSFTTTVLLEASGRSEGGSAQLNSRWKCKWRRPAGDQPPLLLGVIVQEYEEAIVQSPSQTLLSDCTEAVVGDSGCYDEHLSHGIDHWLGRIESHLGLIDDGHYGLAVGDVNGDGLDDVYLGQPGGLPNRLLIQNADGTVTDRSVDSGTDVLDETRSAILVDLDNDGHQDLVLAALRRLLIFSGNGQGQFTLRTEKEGHFQFTLAAADYDTDSDLDLFVCNYSPQSVSDVGRFGLPVPFHNATNGGPNVLLRNDGDWTFTDATAETGLGTHNNRWSYAASWEDFDNDGDLDLYVANDFGHNNLYRNDKARFTDITTQAKAVDANFGMSVTWGDYDRDGWMDIYIANMFSSAGNRVTFQQQFSQQRSDTELSLLQRLARGNTLLRNNNKPDSPGFIDVSDQASTTMGRWSWGSLFADINNDGWQDLLITNGFLTHDAPGDL